MSLRYYINSVEVFPKNAGSETYTFEPRDDGDIVLQRKLTSELVFHYTNSGFDFKSQEVNNISQELTILIVSDCGPADVANYEGLFAVVEGDWNDSICQFTIKPRMKDFILTDVDVNIYSGLATFIPDGIYTGTGGSERHYENAFDFGSVIYCIAKTTNSKIIKVISNFFRINPDGAFYLPGVTNYWDKLAICSLSDIQEPIPSNPATFEQIKFGELMKDLNAIFDVFWFVDANYNLRVEHRLYFEGNVGLDLTDPRYAKYIARKLKYKYDLQAYPDKERWSIVSNNKDCFAELDYNQISDLNKEINQVTFESTKVRTDYISIRYDGKNASTDGLFLFATQLVSGKYRMYENNGLNYTLTPDFLVNNLHKYNRPYLYALYNSFTRINGADYFRNGGFFAISLSKSKKYETINVPLCCGDVFKTQDKIRMPQGYGYVDKAAFDNKTKILSLDLGFENRNNNYVSPTDLSGLDLWIKSDAGITYNPSTFKISKINDFSGHNRHFTQATGSLQLTYDAVNKKVLLLKPGYMLSPAFQINPGKRGTVITLLEMVDPVANTGICVISTQNGAAGPDYDFSYDGGNYISWYRNTFGGGQSPYYSPNDPTGNKSGLFITERTTDTTEFYHHNGNIPYANTEWNPLIVPNTQPVSKALRLGDNQNADLTGTVQTQPVKLLELIIYNRVLTEAEIKNIEFYLAKKGTFVIYPNA